MIEVNFDCLAGPTHFFGGLSLGNMASQKNKNRPSSPKKACLEGLVKMKKLYDLGFCQAILPPHIRPHDKFLQGLGFRDIKKAHEEAPSIFLSALSSSFMWAANMAVISPAIDNNDNKTHISPANLYSMLHRRLESHFSYKILKKIFHNEEFFVVHEPVFGHEVLADEGAANHNRLCKTHEHEGLHIFVYSKDLANNKKTLKYQARQSLLAQEAIKRRHQIKHSIFIEQNPKSIDEGAFHNDVVSVMNENLILCHEETFFKQKEALFLIRNNYIDLFNEEPIIIEIKNYELSLKDAISCYFFNSQLLSKKDGTMMLLAPKEAYENKHAVKVAQKILAQDNPIKEIEYLEVAESMGNGGGPACLRLRALLTEAEYKNIKPEIIFNNKIFTELKNIVNHFYEDEFYIEKVFNQSFLEKTKEAYEAIYQALGLKELLSC